MQVISIRFSLVQEQQSWKDRFERGEKMQLNRARCYDLIDWSQPKLDVVGFARIPFLLRLEFLANLKWATRTAKLS